MASIHLPPAPKFTQAQLDELRRLLDAPCMAPLPAWYQQLPVTERGEAVELARLG